MIKKIISWFFGLLGFVLLIHHIVVFRPTIIETTSSLIAYPFLVVAEKITTTITTYTQRKLSHAMLLKNYELLLKKQDELFAAYVKLRATTQFSQATQELVDFQQRYNFDKAILAKVLTRTINESEHTIILNRGTSHGIKQDMVAIHKLQIVGRVCEIYPTMCKIMLMTDKRCKIAGFTNTTSAGGIVTGSNSHNLCTMDFVSHLSELTDEDFVFSSGQGLIFPEGFCLGKINSHTHDEKELYHAIKVEPLIDFQELRYCLLASQEMINLF